MRRPSERRGSVRSLESVGLATRTKMKDDSKVGGQYHLDAPAMRIERAASEGDAHRAKRIDPLAAPAMRIERAPSEGYAHRAKRIDLLTAPAMRIEWAPSESYAHTAERLYAHKTNLEPPGLCA